MNVQYQIDLEKISLQKFKKSLVSRDMIPSRKSLKDEVDEKFRILMDYGIRNLKELADVLKTKQKIDQFSQETGLSAQYLTLLNREAKSYLAKPIRLDKFPEIRGEYFERLDAIGVRNTRQLFEQAYENREREQLSKETGIPIDALSELVGLADLSRVYGVGPVFARMIYDIGIRSVKEFIENSAEDFIRIYEEQTKKKADFGVSEIQFSLELANELNRAIES